METRRVSAQEHVDQALAAAKKHATATALEEAHGEEGTKVQDKEPCSMEYPTQADPGQVEAREQK